MPPLAIALLALGFVACGGDDGDGTAGPDGSGQQAQADRSAADAETRKRNEEVRKQHRERQQAQAPSEDEREAGRVTASFYEILGEDEGGQNRTTIDSAAFCGLMSEEAREQTIAYAKQASGVAQEWDCEKAIDLLVLRSKRTGGFKQAQRAKVLGVNAEGDRATATVRFGKGPATSISLVKEGGEWKLGASAAGGGG